MGWKAFDDAFDDDTPKKSNPKVRKNPGGDALHEEVEQDHKKRRSGVRAHRKKNNKGQYREENP